MNDMDDSVETGLALARQHGSAAGRPGEFEILGHRWTLLPGVFAPVYTVSTDWFTSWLPYPVGGSFLEVGSGTGVTAVTAALHGCASVAALDISDAAVANTLANVRRHAVDDRVRVLHSDVFDALDARERFDVIYWNSAVIDAPPDFEYPDELHRAFFDRDYSAHARFLRQGPDLLTPAGRIFLGFNTLGNIGRLRALASDLGLRLHTFRRQAGQVGDTPVELSLLEVLRPPPGRSLRAHRH